MSDVPNDMHMAIGQILGSTSHLIKQIDNMGEEFKAHRNEIKQEQAAINSRLAKVEAFMWRQVGLATGASIVLPVVTSVIIWYLTK